MSYGERGREAELRAERVGWKERSRITSQASRNTDEHLRRLSERAGVLDERLSRHGHESTVWHGKWDDPPASS